MFFTGKIMFYTNSKYLNCCDNSDFECHSENIVAEEMECTSIIEEHEKRFHPTQYYVNKNINKTLVSSLASTSLITLTMLEGAAGASFQECCPSIGLYVTVPGLSPEKKSPTVSATVINKIAESTTLASIFTPSSIEPQIISRSVSSYLCTMGKSLCRLINILGSGDYSDKNIKKTLKSAFDYSGNSLGRNPIFNFSIPLRIPYTTGDNRAEDPLISRLWNMGMYFHSTANIALSRRKYSNTEYYSFCRKGDNNIGFCDRNYNVNASFSDICCSNIGSYIIYPHVLTETILPQIVVSTTTESEILTSTTVASKIINSTDIGSEAFNLTTMASEVIGSKFTNLTSEVLNLTTMASEVIGSTVIGSEFTNLTTAESELTTSISTKITPDTTSINALNTVLITFSSLALALATLVFLGYRALKSRKSYQSQPVSQSDNVDTDEREDLV